MSKQNDSSRKASELLVKVNECLGSTKKKAPKTAPSVMLTRAGPNPK